MRDLALLLYSFLLACPFVARAGLTIEADGGAYHGREEKGVKLFPAIAYAKPPVGLLRWRHPVPEDKPLQRVRPVSCPQTMRDTLPVDEDLEMDEDCLYLNVWAPKQGARLPVIFYIHGGAYFTGSGLKSFYDGSVFARRGFVFVAMNYRLSELGYGPSLSKEPGSPGLMDQAMALRWVVKHIEKFGGDPNRIWLMGQSKGAEASAALMESGLADEHVLGAVAYSGPRNFDPAYHDQWLKEMRHDFLPGEQFMDWRHFLAQEGYRFLMPELPSLRVSGQGKNRFKVLVTGITKEFNGDDIFCYETSFLQEAYDYIDSYYYELHPGTRDHGSELTSLFAEDAYGRRLLDHVTYFMEHGEPRNPHFLLPVRPYRESREAIHLFPNFTLTETLPPAMGSKECRELVRPDTWRSRKLDYLEKLSAWLGGRSAQPDFDPLISVEE